MKIIESIVVGKHSSDDCEDGTAITADFAAVADGSTSKTPRRIDPDKSNGRLAMEIITSYIESSLDRNATCDDFCQGVTAAVHDRYIMAGADINWLKSHPEDRLTASAIVYSNARREIWMVGDCQCLIDGHLVTNSKPSEAVIAARRAHLMEGGKTAAEARAMIEPDLVRTMREGQNIKYSVIDGFEIYRPDVRIVDAGEAAHIVLASDGYPFLAPTLRESETLLKRQLREDPQNIKFFKATKGLRQGNVSFDDRSYISISVRE